MSMQSFDVVIIGGGMTGLALACGLAPIGLRVAVLDDKAPVGKLSADAPPALRVSAINPASEALLRYVGAWDRLSPGRLTPYTSMEVWEKDSFAQIAFQALDYDYWRLGHIIENDDIQQALWHAAAEENNITLLTSVHAQSVNRGEDAAFVSLSNGEHISARLLVGADGAHSWLKRQADIPSTFRDYGQHALVAVVKTAEPHLNCARQIFTGDDILAFLPLYDEHLCSIVWSTSPERAELLHECDERYFNQRLTVAFDSRLGLCRLQSERRVFPLTARFAHSFAGQRFALIGDAAHTIHPLAGQGVNLGFMDAIALIDELTRIHKQGRDIGSHYCLRKYEKSRKYEAVLTLAAMQGLQQLFSGVNPLKKLLRDVGLTLADRLPGAKETFARQAAGLDKLPDWLNGRRRSER